MYEGFYSLTNTPFTRRISEDCLFFPPERSEVLSRMEFVSERHLFAVLTGDCGTGKTTILRKNNTSDSAMLKIILKKWIIIRRKHS